MLAKSTTFSIVTTLFVHCLTFQSSFAFAIDTNFNHDDGGMDLSQQKQVVEEMMNIAGHDENQPEHSPELVQAMYQIVTNKLAAEQVAKMHDSDFCPPDFTTQMCQQLKQKGSFYLWLHKLRDEKIENIGKNFIHLK